MILSQILERIAALRDEKTAAEDQVKSINGQLRELESRALELMGMEGLDLVRVAGHSWYRREVYSVSVPEEHKKKVLEVAREVDPELIGVNTTTLKSWLMDRRRDGDDQGESLADGTPFAGLVRESRFLKLSGLKVPT